MKYLYLLLFIANSWIASSQNDVNYYKQKYPNANEVFLKQVQIMEIDLEKDKLNIISNKREESLIITDDVNKINSKGNVTFSSFTQIKDLEAKTEFQNKKYDVKNFRIVRDKNSRTFHDDTKIKEFDYFQLGFGAKKTLQYTTQYLEPNLISGEIFIENYPIEYKEIKIIVDKNVELGYKVFNNENQIIQFTKEEKGNKIIYKWVGKDIQPYKYEVGMPTILYYAPLVEIYIKSYTKNNGEKVTLLNAIEDLHKLYQNYTKNIYETPTQEILKTAQELKSLHSNEIDQVKEIYYWVKDNIKYIAFEDGYGGFIPRNPNDVFVKRYGDCKDMAVIIYTMLRSVGINNVYLTWIGSREKPFTYDQIPTQMVDDHMIATYQNDGVNYFLDGTSKETPFGYPTSFIQGKQALLHKSKEEYELVMVPIVNPEKNKLSGNIEIKIIDNKLAGTATATLTGYVRENLLNDLKDLSGFQKTEFLKTQLQLGNNKFYLEKYDIKNQIDREKQLTIDYNFNIDNYIISAGDEIFVNLFLTKFDELKSLNLKRNVDYHIDNTSNLVQKVKLIIPKGYTVNYLPKNDAFQDNNFSYSVVYSKNVDAVELTIDVKINFLALKKEDTNTWNNFIARLKETASESISIIKIKFNPLK